MRLKRLTIENFRSCTATIVELSDNLTILVGENASGKTGIVDAIRLGTQSALEGRGVSFIPEKDVSHSASDVAKTKIQLRYEDLTPGQLATFLTQVVDEDESLTYTYSFNTSPDVPYWRRASHAVGAIEVEDAEPASRMRLAHVYLPPLRDAVRELDGGNGDRLAEVLKVLTVGDTDLRQGFIDDANLIVDKVVQLPLPENARNKIEEHLKEITPPSRQHAVHFNGRRHELRRLASMMKLQLMEAGINPIELGSSGLGYANLVFIATIVLQLANARDYDLTLLLVEEPEAHLHPQLQSVLLDYLRQQAMDSRASADAMSTEPAGRIQVVVSTHSPQLASSVSVEEVVVVSRHHDSQVVEQNMLAASPLTETATNQVDLGGEVVEPWSTKTTALGQLELNEWDYRKINRYLNATRSALLFARHIFLVEGIAEAILIPELAKRHPRAQSPEAKRHLSSVAYVPIDGVDFEPYLQILLKGDFARVDRIVVLTDGDLDKTGTQQGASRKRRLEQTFESDVTAGRLRVRHGLTTLEADIFGLSTNEELLRDAYLQIHPRSAQKWDDAMKDLGNDSDIRSKAFARLLKQKEGGLDLGKGDFAQLVTEALHQGKSLAIPDYINQALEDVLDRFGVNSFADAEQMENSVAE